MIKFQATAYNKDELTFVFFFYNSSWCLIEEKARKTLDKIIENDKSHQKYGPWEIRGIDVSA